MISILVGLMQTVSKVTSESFTAIWIMIATGYAVAISYALINQFKTKRDVLVYKTSTDNKLQAINVKMDQVLKELAEMRGSYNKFIKQEIDILKDIAKSK